MSVKPRRRSADNYSMLGLLGVAYIVALIVVLRDRRDSRRELDTLALTHLPEADRPPVTAPTAPLPNSWVGIYVEDGIAALSDFLAERGRDSAT